MKFSIRKLEFSRALAQIQAASRKGSEYSSTYDRVFIRARYGVLTLLGYGPEGEVKISFDSTVRKSPLSGEMENGMVAFIIGSIPSRLETGKRDMDKVSVVYSENSPRVFLESGGERIERSVYREGDVIWQEMKKAS